MLTSLSLAVAVALGVGAIDSNSITVLLDGRPTKIVLAGVAPGDARAAEFAQCLVAQRVVRISGPHSAARVTMLDDTSVSAHISEFIQTQTTSDPCALGQAAYQPKALRVAAPATAAAEAPLPAVKKKAPHEVHVSVSGSGTNKGGLSVLPPLPAGSAPYTPTLTPAAAQMPTEPGPTAAQPYAPPTVGTYTPSTVTTAPVVNAGTAQLPQQGTQQPQQAPPATVPTTTVYRPPV